MIDEKELKGNEGGGVNLGRHQAQCTICSSPYRQQIEQEWISWHSPKHFAELFDVSRDALYRHAHALDLFSKRRRNITMALEKIIETVDHVSVSGSNIISAVRECVKITSAEQGKENQQGAGLKKLLEQMSAEERESFARDGSLPDWFSGAIAATPGDGQEAEKESQVTETKRLQ